MAASPSATSRLWRRTLRLVCASLLAIPACGTVSEDIEYRRQDAQNLLLDDYYSMKGDCTAHGLAVAVEQNRTPRCSGLERRANGGFCPPCLGDRLLGCVAR